VSGILFDRARSSPDPGWRTIGELVGDAAERFADREFLRFPGTSLSFAGAHAASNRLAHVLIAHGVRPGDRVAIMMGNVPDWPLTWFAIGKAGAVAVPVNARYREADLGFVLADSAAVMVLATDEHAGLVRAVAAATGTVREVLTPAQLTSELAAAPASDPVVPVEPDGIANFQYTSGTTGFPKACMLSHDYWLRTGWLTATVREHDATLTYVLGAMPMLMFAQPASALDRDHRVRLVLCSGIVPDLHRKFEERWGVPWREIYGSTESGLDLAVPPGAAQTVGTGAMGRPPPGKQVRIGGETDGTLPDGEVGQILIQGKPMMTGYWNHPDSTERAFRGGWYHTGDLGFRDAEGWIHHAGRLKDMIRRGGENISAVEVEHVLALHPAVAAVALVPIPDEMFGELPKAFIQLAPGHQPSTQTAESVLGHARGKLARFKVPAYLEFVETFPMTPSARIQKTKLLDQDRDQRTGVFDAAANTWV
jgi:acyl-CoA synthetase (AMP-forming)/AMP-acid ligase II